jgi:hypothetical protein
MRKGQTQRKTGASEASGSKLPGKATTEAAELAAKREQLFPQLEEAEREAKAEFRALLGHMEAAERQGVALGRVLRRLHGGEPQPDGSHSPRLYVLRGVEGGWEGYMASLVAEIESPVQKKLSVSWSYDLMRAARTADELSARAESVPQAVLEGMTTKQLTAASRFLDPVATVAKLTEDGKRPVPSAMEMKRYGQEHPQELALTGRKGAEVSAPKQGEPPSAPASVLRWVKEVGVDGVGRLVWEQFPEEIGDLVVWLVGKLAPEDWDHLMERLQEYRRQ